MEKNMNQKFLVLLTALLLALSLFAGCSAGNTAADNTPSLSSLVQKDEAESGSEEAALPADEDADSTADEDAESTANKDSETADEEADELTDENAFPDEELLGALLDEAIPLTDGPALSTVLKPEAPGTAIKVNSSAGIDYSNASDGYIMVRWVGETGSRVKVLIKGPSGTTYQYNLKLDGSYEAFPLSDGSGSYTAGVYRNTSGTQYATILTATMIVSLKDEFAPFIRPNQYVNYSEDNEAVKKAAELCKNAEDNLAKVEKVYNFVIKNTVYDKAKAQTVKSGYLPDIDDTLRTGKGICFDYAALMAAMLRSQGVPVKLVVCYTGSAYHAWLSVYSETDGWIEGKIYFDGESWKLMDPTFASSGGNSDAIVAYIGNGSNYSAKYLY